MAYIVYTPTHISITATSDGPLRHHVLYIATVILIRLSHGLSLHNYHCRVSRDSGLTEVARALAHEAISAGIIKGTPNASYGVIEKAKTR